MSLIDLFTEDLYYPFHLRLDSILTWIVQQLQLQHHTPGANPATIQAFVTKPLEATVGSSKGIDYMTSKSVLGN